MKKIINFFKQYWLFILLATIATIILLLWLSQRVKRTRPPVPGPTPTAGVLPQPQSKFSQLLGEGIYYNILFSESEFDKIPQTLPVYQTKEFTKEEIISRYVKIISDLGFSGNPEEQQRPDGKYLVWQEGNNYLGINVSSGQFMFSGKTSLSSSPETTTFTSSQIQNLIKQKLISWELISEEAKIKEINGFGVAGLELVPVPNLSQAVIFQIIIEPYFESYSLVGLGPAKNLIEAKADYQGILLSLFFNLHQVDREIVDYYPIKSFEETTREIKNGQAQVIQVLTSKQEERSIPSLEEILSVKFTSITVAYYETTEAQEFYQPIFLLKGNISLKEGEILQATFILPAISGEYLKPFQEHLRP